MSLPVNTGTLSLQTSRFLALPAELRGDIYDLLVHEDDAYQLVTTCAQVWNELIPKIFKNSRSRFILHTDHRNTGHMLDPTFRITLERDPSLSLKNLRIVIDKFKDVHWVIRVHGSDEVKRVSIDLVRDSLRARIRWVDPFTKRWNLVPVGENVRKVSSQLRYHLKKMVVGGRRKGLGLPELERIRKSLMKFDPEVASRL